jgi:hypothetical protein
MQDRAYLGPNSGSLQKPIGGRSVLAQKPPISVVQNCALGIQHVFQPLNKRARIDEKSHNSLECYPNNPNEQ